MRATLITCLVVAFALLGAACSAADADSSLGAAATADTAGAGGATGGGSQPGDVASSTDTTGQPSDAEALPEEDAAAGAEDTSEPAADVTGPEPTDADDDGGSGALPPGVDAGPSTSDAESADSGEPTTSECEADQIVNCEGGCTTAAWLNDDFCDTVLDCEALDFDGGDCVPVCGDAKCNGEETYETCPEDCVGPVAGGNHPCETSNEPGSNDEEITACACAQDSWCCTNTWDAFCVQLASDPCGAMCDCTDLTCAEDADCGGCFGDACVGSWTCGADGLCVQSEPVVCTPSEDGGCLANQCDPATGACVTSAADELCDDSSACTVDSCDGDTGECSYAPSDLCGDQHPCVAAETPGSADAGVQACLCELDTYCCTTAWDPACVAGAEDGCGLVCNCLEASPELLACATDEDCAWCGEDACSGPFTCDAGTCQASAPVVCDAADDAECSKNLCNPDTGACEVTEDVAFCDDADPCTLDVCDAETGACSHSAVADCGVTHPCEPTSTPASSDAEINACVCAIAPACCESQWQPYCIEIAVDHCDLTCECEDLDPETLTCSENADCTFCDDGDMCNGSWSCQGGVCAAVPSIECDTANDTGCIAAVCNPATGACEDTADVTLCDDGDPCTDETCDEVTGACSSEVNASCGLNHPCVSAPFPTSNDEEVTACVCELDAYCCQTAWDGLCVEKAEQNCGMVCTCDDPLAPVACEDEADCAGCDDGDQCNGSWGCVDGICMALNDEVVCDPDANVGCQWNACVPATGACELTPNPAVCDDGDSCTADSCRDDGECVSEPIEGCTLNHPCAISEFPESSDEEITACVCDLDPWCCENNWDNLCVGGAENDCGAVCDCADPAAELTCEADADCAWCAEDLCDTPWSCVDGQCAAGEAVVCDASADTDCQLNQCDPLTGACAMVQDVTACDDEDPCSIDSCSAEGVCEHEAIDGCEGEPPFECLGSTEPSAEGCGVVESYEGCCDPWGRVTWCQDGATYCIQCQENPVCGWDDGGGYYNCGTPGGEDPSGAAPLMCSAFAP